MFIGIILNLTSKVDPFPIVIDCNPLFLKCKDSYAKLNSIDFP